MGKWIEVFFSSSPEIKEKAHHSYATKLGKSPDLILKIVGGRRNKRFLEYVGFASNWKIPVFKRKKNSGFCVVVNVDKENEQIDLTDGGWNPKQNVFTPTTIKQFSYTAGATQWVPGISLVGTSQGEEGKQWIAGALSPFVETFAKGMGIDIALQNHLDPNTGRVRRRRVLDLQRMQKLTDSTERNPA